MRPVFRFLIIVGCAVVLMLPFFWAFPKDLTLNQLLIGQETLRNNPLSFTTLSDQLKTLYRLGLNELFNEPPSVDYTDPKQFFGYIFSRLPGYAVVYPTETYYYYQVVMPDGKHISGNLRLLDAQDGVMHIGYFDKNDPHNPDTESWAGDFGKAEGVDIKTINPYEFDVTYNEKTVRFKLSSFVHDTPKSLSLLPDEEFVSQIFDESGIRFSLLYNTSTASFYYVVNEDVGINEDIEALDDNYLLGKRTNYIYYRDSEYDRRLLVGVSENEIFQNSYYDGSFDQVPPRLSIKEKLELAYPYVKYRGGIDEHGNFKEIDGSRVAISPYYNYESLEDIKDYQSRCKREEGPSKFWSCLTYEWKKDFHKGLEADGILP